MNEAAAIATEMQSKIMPPIIEFMRQPIEDVAASKQAGHYVAKDVDFIIITTRNGKGDNIIWKVETWKANWEQEVRAQRLPATWLERALAYYEKWKSGQEIPLDGVAIKGWGVISPAQQEMLIRLNIKTVEHLASLNDEGRSKIGMGALDLQRKAAAWLSQLQDKGPLTMKVSALQQDNDVKNGQIETLTRQVAELTARMNAQPPASAPTVPSVSPVSTGPIDVKQILDEVNLEAKETAGTPPQRRTGRRRPQSRAEGPVPSQPSAASEQPANSILDDPNEI